MAFNNYFKKFSNDGIPFMDGSAKGEITTLVGERLHIVDFGFISNRNGKFAVVAFAEHPHMFYFGGMVLTGILEQIDEDNMRDQLKQQTVVLTMRDTKDGERHYMGVEFPAD